jgi:hypothetical protein
MIGARESTEEMQPHSGVEIKIENVAMVFKRW